MRGLNKFTKTIHINENIKEQGSTGIVAAFEKHDSETISSEDEIKTKCNYSNGNIACYPEGALAGYWRQGFFDNRYTYHQVNSAFVSLPQYLVSIHSNKHLQNTEHHEPKLRSLHLKE